MVNMIKSPNAIAEIRADAVRANLARDADAGIAGAVYERNWDFHFTACGMEVADAHRAAEADVTWMRARLSEQDLDGLQAAFQRP